MKQSNHKKILWVAPSSEIRDTDVPAEFIKWKAKTLLKKVKIIHWASLHKEKSSDYDFIILDEYHLITESNSRNLEGRILGLSGTHPEEEEKRDILNNLRLKIAYKLSIDESVQLGLISSYTINVVEYELDTSPLRIKTKKGGFDTTERKYYDYLTRNIARVAMYGKPSFFSYLHRQRTLHTFKSRLKVARKILSKFNEEDRTLIFTTNIAQAESLSSTFYHSKTSDKAYKAFQEEKINTLALVNMASIGTTFRNMDNCLLVGTNSKAKNFQQKFCRILVPRENYHAEVYVICALHTQDEKWVETALAGLNSDNVKRIKFKDL